MGKVWKVGGVASRELSTTSKWATRKKAGNWELTTRYEMVLWEHMLTDVGVCVRWRSMKGGVHEGGAKSRKGTEPLAGYCRDYEKGSEISITDTRATRYEGGLSAPKLVGFDLNSTAGFSDSEQITVKITKKKRKICGTNKFPADQPKRVVVRKRGQSNPSPCLSRPCADGPDGLQRQQ